MKVLYLRSNPVNPDSRVEKEVNFLLKEGYDVDILALNREETHRVRVEKKFFQNGYVNVFLLGIQSEYGGGRENILAMLKFQFNIAFHLFKYKYDVVHAADLDTSIFPTLLKKVFSFDIVYDIFDFYADSHNFSGIRYSIVKSIEHFIINKSDATIICSEKRKNQIAGSKPKKLYVVHNTPESLIKESCLSRNNSKMKICYVGVLGNGRMISELMDIVGRNPKEFELHIGGFGHLYDEVRKKADFHENIFFYGKMSYEDTLALESSCDVLTALYDPDIKNHYYAAPNKFYEGLMLGKPLIMIKNTGMDYIVSDYHVGKVIENMCENELEDALKSLMLNKDQWPEMAQKMKLLYEQEFSWSQMEVRLRKLYEELQI